MYPRVSPAQRYARHNWLTHVVLVNDPVHPNHSSDDPTPEDLGKSVNLWFAVAVIGLFVFACFYVLKAAVDLFFLSCLQVFSDSC
jgi:hypothetical protein